MNTSELIAGIDEELSILREARALLTGDGANRPTKRRKMSAAGRARIAAAQKKRWAKQKAASK